MRYFSCRDINYTKMIIRVSFMLMLLWIDSGRAEDHQHFIISGPPPDKVLLLGEKIFRDGILPFGEPTQAVVSGDMPVAGTAFSCMSCHLRSGLGSLEGRVVTPPTNGKKLFAPFTITLFITIYQKESTPLTHRPAYTDESLAEAICGGVDPTGRVLDDVMPRYMM